MNNLIINLTIKQIITSLKIIFYFVYNWSNERFQFSTFSSFWNFQSISASNLSLHTYYTLWTKTYVFVHNTFLFKNASRWILYE